MQARPGRDIITIRSYVLESERCVRGFDSVQEESLELQVLGFMLK